MTSATHDKPPVLHLFAGPNGVGKSTLFAARVASGALPSALPFVNADVYEREQLSHIADAEPRNLAARLWAEQARSDFIGRQQSFAAETVFSHPSKLDLISQAQAAGFVVVLYVLCVDKPELLLARVAQRVQEGGHTVPPERILARYARSTALLKTAIRLADMAFLYDTQPAKALTHTHVACIDLVAVVEKTSHECIGKGTDTGAALPKWAKRMLGLR